ncbi:hypothetical protein HRbin36_00417 [bacterium HR36]|nr:hypothetical protein HRbin36_00417 [bacterium HR36]
MNRSNLYELLLGRMQRDFKYSCLEYRRVVVHLGTSVAPGRPWDLTRSVL